MDYQNCGYELSAKLKPTLKLSGDRRPRRELKPLIEMGARPTASPGFTGNKTGGRIIPRTGFRKGTPELETQCRPFLSLLPTSGLIRLRYHRKDCDLFETAGFKLVVGHKEKRVYGSSMLFLSDTRVCAKLRKMTPDHKRRNNGTFI
ncbi:hypothetical protein J6590_079281 [Homalodisca vitripennis]|nr:hypothetical protein J6590_079281 [Homalodisca vitripennis]